MHYQLVKTEASFWYTYVFCFSRVLERLEFHFGHQLANKICNKWRHKYFFTLHLFTKTISCMQIFDSCMHSTLLLLKMRSYRPQTLYRLWCYAHSCLFLPVCTYQMWFRHGHHQQVHAHWFQLLCCSLFSKFIAACDRRLIYQNSQKDPTGFFPFFSFFFVFARSGLSKPIRCWVFSCFFIVYWHYTMAHMNI